MKPSILVKLQRILTRYEELKTLLSDPNVVHDLNRFRELSKEYAQLEPSVQLFLQYQQCQKRLDEAKELLLESDPDMQTLAKLEENLLVMLLPKDPYDQNNIFLEIRAGTGGDEAAIFAGDLARMYMRYADAKKFKIEVISESPGEHGGYKEIIMRVLG